MSGIRLSTCFALLLSLGLAGPATTAFAELPPQAYEQMQKSAPESLQIDVLTATDRREPGKTVYTVHAKVSAVTKTESNVKVGDLIKIQYEVVDRPAGFVGPSPVPGLTAETSYPAFLAKNKTTGAYLPAAGSHSFVPIPPPPPPPPPPKKKKK